MKTILEGCCKPWLCILMILAMAGSLPAQKFYGTGGVIPIDGKPGNYPIKVAGLPTSIGPGFGLEKVCVNLVHTWDNDVSIYLLAPDGTVIDLARRNGDEGDNYTNCCFTDQSEESIDDAYPPFTGFYRPEIHLGAMNNGQNPNGSWKLIIVDTYPMEENGRLLNWNMTFGKSASPPNPFHSSTLPILQITTKGQPILDEPKIKVQMRIVDNGPGNVNDVKDTLSAFQGTIAMELRGRSSQRHPKLSFAVETLDSAGQKGKAVQLPGLPKEKDFVLTANHSDKSLLRNYMAYTLFGQMGHYAPRVRFVDVMIDGDYRGVYLLGEKIKRGKDRVNISKLDADDNAGDSLTGGYIIKTDWAQGSNNGGWTSNYYPMQGTELQEWGFHYPEADDITEPQKAYIKSFVDSFEIAIDSGWTDGEKGYAHYIDLKSFVDMMIMVELGRNVDGYWLSSYYYKDKNSVDAKLHAGPIWDYDLAFGNFEFYQGYSPAGWHWETYGKTSEHIPRFWHYLAQEPGFQDLLKCRWTELRKNVLSLEHVYALIDAAAKEIDASQQQNFAVWPILGQYIWTTPKPYEEDYAGEIRRLKEWFLLRMTWMDAYMPGNCK